LQLSTYYKMVRSFKKKHVFGVRHLDVVWQKLVWERRSHGQK